jgi:hypothetical protein
MKDNQKQLLQLKAQVNIQIERMRKDFSEDNMGFRTLQKEGQKQAGEKLVSMNLKEAVKPNYGVVVKNGEEINKGPDFMARNIEGKMSRKEYLEKF